MGKEDLEAARLKRNFLGINKFVNAIGLKATSVSRENRVKASSNPRLYVDTTGEIRKYMLTRADKLRMAKRTLKARTLLAKRRVKNVVRRLRVKK